MVKNNNKHIYFGLGTLTLIGLGAFVIISSSKRKRKRFKFVNQKSMDLSAFDSPDRPGSGHCMDKELITMLQQLEIQTGYPIFKWINSGARSAFWNSKVGGVSNSSHKMPFCKAVDIKAPSKAIRNRLVLVARNIGFKRIGVGNTFVHLDTDTNKSQYVAWGYPSGNKPEINPFV